jgi:hypothetical protein
MIKAASPLLPRVEDIAGWEGVVQTFPALAVGLCASRKYDKSYFTSYVVFLSEAAMLKRHQGYRAGGYP